MSRPSNRQGGYPPVLRSHELPSRLARACVAIAALPALAACTSAPQVAAQDDRRAVIASDNDGGMDALLVGELTVAPNNCWALIVDESQEPVPVVWPHGTELVEEGMRLPGTNTVVDVGAGVALGGGFVEAGR